MSEIIKCMACGLPKTRSEFSVSNLARNRMECLKCQSARRSKSAMERAKARREHYAEANLAREAERKAKVDALFEQNETLRTPVKLYKTSPKTHHKIDEILYNKEVENINSMYEL